MDSPDLLATTDGEVWAQEFMRRFGDRLNESVDEGLMISWFANAIETGRTAGEARLRDAIQNALNELGVPGEGYLAPVANAHAILSAVA